MRNLDVLCGNAQLKRRLQSGRDLAHAYILAGPAGCGKRTLAALLAQAMVCTGEGEAPCGRCSGCRKAAAGIHPDVVRLGGGEKDITVSQVRELKADAYIRPNESDRKVYILENAQDMNESAQNALLKLLEEGPPYASFLFLTDNAGAILPTVRSRCELLSLSPVTPAEAEAWLLSRHPDLPRERVLEAADRCEGSLGRAEAWLEGDGDEARRLQETAGRLTALMAAGNEPALLELCAGLEKWDREALAALLDEAVGQLRNRLARREGSAAWALRTIRLLEELRSALAFHTGSGHIAGWLCAAACSGPSSNTRDMR